MLIWRKGSLKPLFNLMELLLKKNLIVIIILFVVIGAGGYLWISMSDSDMNTKVATNTQSNASSADKVSVESQTTGGDGVSVTTDKSKYRRGEDIKFVVTNNTENAIWYIIPVSKCDKNFFGHMSRRGSNNEWSDGVVVWLVCEDQNAKVDSLKIVKLEPGKSLEQQWNQDIFIPTDSVASFGKDTDKMFPGIYRFVFPYAEKEIVLKDIPSLDALEGNNFLPQQSFSDDFEIEDDGTIASATNKANDAMRKSNLSYISARLISYFDDHNNKYPVSGDKMVKLNDENSVVYKELVPEYLSDDYMKDPKDPDSYFGYRSSDGKDFELSAVLENTADKDCIKTNNLCIYKYTSNGAVSGQ